jgi:hypothetical protein
MRKFSRRWVLHSLSSAQQMDRVEASKEMLRILQESEANHFDGIATGDESWFQYLDSSSEMFARSRSDIVPRMRHGLGTKKNHDHAVLPPKETRRSQCPANREDI